MRRTLFLRMVPMFGTIGAALLSVSLNVLSARHFRRWDFTSDARFSLSRASEATLESLPDHIRIWVVIGAHDPLRRTLAPLLAAYRSKSSQIEIRYVDPDQDSLELLDLKKRFDIDVVPTAGGKLVADAVMVIERGSRRWIVTADDLVADADRPAIIPQAERAITSAIRSVLGGESPDACFLQGHGELGTVPRASGWVGQLVTFLQKDNFTVREVELTPLSPADVFAKCTVVIGAGPALPFVNSEVERLRAYAGSGGHLFLALGPIFAEGNMRPTSAGLQDLLQDFGVDPLEAIVVEQERARVIPETRQLAFVAKPVAHPILRGLTEDGSPKIVLINARPFRQHVVGTGVIAAPLLTSSETAILLHDAGRTLHGDAIVPLKSDERGPAILAMASERPKVNATDAHGPRLVVMGSRLALSHENFDQPMTMRGTAFLVEASIGWLAARPPVVDIPEKKPMSVRLLLSEASRKSIRYYVLLWMPLASALLGVFVWLRRRS